MQRIQARRDHLASLTAAAKVQRNKLKTISQDLQVELNNLERAEELFDQAKKESESTQGHVNFLQKSIANFRARPEISRIHPTKDQLAKNKLPRHRGTTPVSTPVAGGRQATPVSTPSTGGRSSGSVLSRPSFSSRSAFGYSFDPNVGGKMSASSSDDEDDEDDEEEHSKIANDKDVDLKPIGKGDGKGDNSTGDGDKTKDGEVVDKANEDFAPRNFGDLDRET
jgi:hypothetical protein